MVPRGGRFGCACLYVLVDLGRGPLLDPWARDVEEDGPVLLHSADGPWWEPAVHSLAPADLRPMRAPGCKAA